MEKGHSMSNDELNQKIQRAYERTLADLSENKDEIEVNQENMFNLALLYSGKVTAYLLEELGLIN